MREQPIVTRQALGCGYLPPAPEGFPVQPWDHPGREPAPDERDAKGKLRLPICPGYACSLPEVLEASHARAFAEQGELTQFCDGGVASRKLRDAITILNIERGQLLEWSAKERR